MQAFVAHGPADDLPHPLHLVEAREVHQHGEAGEQLQPFGKAAEHGQRAGDILVRIDAEILHDNRACRLHLLIFEEHAEYSLSGMPIVSSK